MFVHRFYVYRKFWTGGGGWGHPHIAVHMVAVRVVCKKVMVENGWANSWIQKNQGFIWGGWEGGQTNYPLHESKDSDYEPGSQVIRTLRNSGTIYPHPKVF